MPATVPGAAGTGSCPGGGQLPAPRSCSEGGEDTPPIGAHTASSRTPTSPWGWGSPRTKEGEGALVERAGGRGHNSPNHRSGLSAGPCCWPLGSAPHSRPAPPGTYRARPRPDGASTRFLIPPLSSKAVSAPGGVGKSPSTGLLPSGPRDRNGRRPGLAWELPKDWQPGNTKGVEQLQRRSVEETAGPCSQEGFL